MYAQRMEGRSVGEVGANRRTAHLENDVFVHHLPLPPLPLLHRRHLLQHPGLSDVREQGINLDLKTALLGQSLPSVYQPRPHPRRHRHIPRHLSNVPDSPPYPTRLDSEASSAPIASVAQIWPARSL